VFISIYIGAEKASIIGLALGLIIDISVGKYFGYYGLLFIAVGYLYGSLKEKVFKENIFTVILLVIIATIIDNLLISTIIGFRGIELGIFLLRIVEAVFINGIISAFLFYPLNIVLNKVEEQW
jgi:rod shape-determining protein MreD